MLYMYILGIITGIDILAIIVSIIILITTMKGE